MQQDTGQWAKSPKKQSEGVHVKNTLLQTAFSAILPAERPYRFQFLEMDCILAKALA